MLDAAVLFDLAEAALSLVGPARYRCADDPRRWETLTFLAGEADGGGPTWALVADGGGGDDCVPVDAGMAADLIARHLAGWLAERGWQVQGTLSRRGRQWRLVDVLSPAGGGGDRLDGDYPQGEDELTVLCRSVEAAATARPCSMTGL